MKTLLLLCLSISVACIAGGCASFPQSRSYSVTVGNIGNKTICIDQIELCPKHTAGFVDSIPVGTLTKGEWAGYGPFCDILKEVTVKWNVVETGKTYMRNIAIKLPKRFYNEEWNSRLYFYINPDREKVWVAYSVFDEREEEYVIVDSEGKSFPIDDYAEAE